MAYVLGFLYADGTITRNSRGGEYIVLQIKDKELLDTIRRTLESDHKVSQRIHRKDHSVFYRLQIGSKEMCSDLSRLGVVERKTHRLKMPRISSQYIGSFIRGYFDGDGHVWTGAIHKERKTTMRSIQTTFTSCSLEFLESLQTRLASRGIIGRVTCRNTFYRLSYSILSSLKLYELMYTNLGTDLYLGRKKKIFESYILQRMRP
jgi:hypothetical protein